MGRAIPTGLSCQVLCLLKVRSVVRQRFGVFANAVHAVRMLVNTPSAPHPRCSSARGALSFSAEAEVCSGFWLDRSPLLTPFADGQTDNIKRGHRPTVVPTLG